MTVKSDGACAGHISYCFLTQIIVFIELQLPFSLAAHSEHLGQSLDQASDVCRRSNMLRKLTCIAGSSYLSAALNEILP